MRLLAVVELIGLSAKLFALENLGVQRSNDVLPVLDLKQVLLVSQAHLAVVPVDEFKQLLVFEVLVNQAILVFFLEPLFLLNPLSLLLLVDFLFLLKLSLNRINLDIKLMERIADRQSRDSSLVARIQVLFLVRLVLGLLQAVDLFACWLVQHKLCKDVCGDQKLRLAAFLRFGLLFVRLVLL